MEVKVEKSFLRDASDLFPNHPKAEALVKEFISAAGKCSHPGELKNYGLACEALSNQKPYFKVKKQPYRLIFWLEKPNTIHLAEIKLRDSQTYGKKNQRNRR